MKGHTVIIRPIITEKSMDNAGKGKFAFQVAMHADKPAIKKAVEKQFKVNVVATVTTIVKGKTKRAGKQREVVALASWKKAVVELAQGQKIDLFDVGA